MKKSTVLRGDRTGLDRTGLDMKLRSRKKCLCVGCFALTYVDQVPTVPPDPSERVGSDLISGTLGYFSGWNDSWRQDMKLRISNHHPKKTKNKTLFLRRFWFGCFFCFPRSRQGGMLKNGERIQGYQSAKVWYINITSHRKKPVTRVCWCVNI